MILDDATIGTIEELSPLAPLHNPGNLQAIRLCRALWPAVPQAAVFDTSFHLTNPPFATTYAVFAARRAYDFIAMAIAEEKLPVRAAASKARRVSSGGRFEL